MTEIPKILLVGIGTAGSRAAFYLYQRGALENGRILAVDSDPEQLQRLHTLDTLAVPPPPALPAGAQAARAREALETGLESRLQDCQMLMVVTCLGGKVCSFYAQVALGMARSRGIPAVAAAALPHAFDSTECQERASQTLEVLFAQHFHVLPLDCAQMGPLFPDPSRENAYEQAVRWIGETAIGYLALFLQPRVDARRRGDSEDRKRMMEFDELPRGIFASLRPAILNQQNLDVPTCIRLKLDIPTLK